jgi:hypothetical protein
LGAKEAVEIARGATPATQPARDAGDPNERRPGQIFPEAYGRDPVPGELQLAASRGRFNV